MHKKHNVIGCYVCFRRSLHKHVFYFSDRSHSLDEILSLGLKEALEERKTLIDERLTCCIEKKIPPVQDAVHEVKAMAAKLRARAEAVKSEICATAEECVKRIVSRKQEMLARVNTLITNLFCI